MGSDESHFNIAWILRGKVTRQCPQTTTVEERGDLKQGIEPMSSAYQPDASLPGQAGSRNWLKACSEPVKGGGLVIS